MSASSLPLADRERAELADLFDQLGPDAPTCCAGWTTAHLAAHLVVRESRPDALPGYGLEQVGLGAPLVAWAHRLEDRLRTSTPYAEVVRRFREGPPPWSPMALPGGRGLNTTEFVIHHEDARRAQPGAEPRSLPREVQDSMWTAVSLLGRRAARRKGGLVLRRSDVPGVEKRYGEARTTVEGEPLELLLWTAGRKDVARVTVT
ncbi:MAG: TIGR03085 family metal-binding protein [Blastococcus sp.]